jgi:predicted RNase H-like HicB family nuclease
MESPATESDSSDDGQTVTQVGDSFEEARRMVKDLEQFLNAALDGSELNKSSFRWPLRYNSVRSMGIQGSLIRN